MTERADGENLVPVFIPALAHLLGAAEKEKGAPLTAEEVLAFRDNGTCIMMTADHALAMSQSRGFVDVVPENAWADWHRLQAQMTGGYLPRIILCFPGGADLRERCEPILKANNVEYEFRQRDPNLLRSFRSASMTWPVFSSEDFARIDGHSTVLYALSKNYTAAEAPEVGRNFFRLGRQLLDAGAYAVKCDSSGMAHSITRWTRFDEGSDHSEYDRWVALFRAFVVVAIGSASDYYTCGMHLLGFPDLIVSRSAISGVEQACHLFRVFGPYLVGECKTGCFASGHTFSTEKDAPRFRANWEPCSGFAEDDYFFNPFGRWRFTQP